MSLSYLGGSPTVSSPKRLMTSVETSSIEFSTANKIGLFPYNPRQFMLMSI